MNNKEKYDWMVYVSCMTFNHASFIEDAMNGFTMQETNFPFVCAIVDDASTDGEQEVIKKYLNEHFDLKDKNVARYEETDDYLLSFVRHKTNLNCYFAVLFLKYNHRSIKKPKLPYIAKWSDNAKYMAHCEGDDYWTNPLKLQKQVDFLEVNPDYTMCFHSVGRVLDGSVVGRVSHFDKESDVKPYTIIHEGGLYCPFCSMVYRREYLDDRPTFRKIADVGDGPLAILLSLRGKVRYFPDVMGCYRLFAKGSWSSMNKKSPERLFKHYLAGHKWYKELDIYTEGMYKDAIYHRICMTSVDLYKHGVINKQTLFENFSQLSWGKDKFRHYYSFLLFEYPIIYKAGHFIKQSLRKINKIWQKKKN